ncbi:DNA alkylation repair protein [Aliifodinibius sp. S!AR15-10]|uniref:DNA alkylation repair protein n=1 Tax=Aliifodinibius sp. S!AR15-10 TaxID=2950437 RepID=UPI00285D4C95|nr:DNA alkylation repair protein [Aliifodinibius sp. S!AR15-10]MDR8393316.1 DNA alkylation repair protein [Aliifodinibius sp. S!AR15-10]
MDYTSVQKKLREQADEEIATHSKRFFKTGKGQYGEGDKFLGIRVPVQRKVAKSHKELPLQGVEKLLQSEYHEERLTAVFILTYKFEKGDEELREKVYHYYMENIGMINNWDLVDSSAPKIVGPHLENRDRSVLYDLAGSDNLWSRRIAIMSCMHFINQGDFSDAQNIAELLLHNEHDLIHKAVGWALREIGNKDMAAEEKFLKSHYQQMPRTMLRYAIEKFPEQKRKAYLKGII